MRLASHRDGIAREYATAFEVTFETGAPALERARQDGLPWDDAVVETFLSVLASNPDTHVVRRAGVAAAEEVSAWARQTLSAGGVRSTAGRRAIDEMDIGLRDARNLRNPGTTADLTTAAIFVELLESWKCKVKSDEVMKCKVGSRKLDRFSIRRRAEALASADTCTLKRAIYGETQIV